MYFTTVVIVLVSLCAVEILAVDENYVAPNDGTLIENCCDLIKTTQFLFGETTTNKSLKFTNSKIFVTRTALQ